MKGWHLGEESDFTAPEGRTNFISQNNDDDDDN